MTDRIAPRKVLLTGSEGRVGSPTAAALEHAGIDVVRFDRTFGQEMSDFAALHAAAEGCEAIVHLAANMDETPNSAASLLTDNLVGIWNVLRASADQKVSRIVFASSIQATGVVQGYRDPDYLPLDNAHPTYASTAYALSKRLGEEACANFTRSTGIATICLRPPLIIGAGEYPTWEDRRATIDEASDPYWNYGSWIDALDFARALVCAVECPDPGPITLLVAAGDIASDRPGLEVVAQRYPGVTWRGGPEYDADPYRSLVDIRPAMATLGWEPTILWQARRSNPAVDA